MGFELSVTDGIREFADRVDALEREQVPFVTAYALTKTAQDARAAIEQEIERVFDRPTRFALNSLFVRPATKRELVATVDFKEGFGSIPAWRFLGPEVAGGPRNKKSHERALDRAGILQPDEYCVPGKGIKLDAYGNMPGSEIARILSQLGASPDATQNATPRSRAKQKRKGTRQYFVMRGRSNVPDGIYRRDGRVAVPVLLFVVGAPRYHKRLAFYEIAKRTVADRFGAHFHEGWQRFVIAQRIPF
jgi:hypothetical protein